MVGWNTVRLLLILTATLGLATKKVDYTLAFVQAKLDPKEPPMLIGMTKMFKNPGHVLRLKQSLYGMKQSPLIFYLHLKNSLEQRGFERSNIAPCLFHNDKVISLIYVDDCLFFAKDAADIDDTIQDLIRTPMNKDRKTFLLDKE